MKDIMNKEFYCGCFPQVSRCHLQCNACKNEKSSKITKLKGNKIYVDNVYYGEILGNRDTLKNGNDNSNFSFKKVSGEITRFDNYCYFLDVVNRVKFDIQNNKL